MSASQPGILTPIPKHSRYLEFTAIPGGDTASALRGLAARAVLRDVVVGLGPGLVLGLGAVVDGLRPFPALAGPGCGIPSTQADLWCWIRGEDRGDILHRARALETALRPAFYPPRVVDGFKYGRGLDLTGYEDGTENPKGSAARAAAIVAGRGRGLDGSSFVAVQRWSHDLGRFAALSRAERDRIIGRRSRDNAELARAPAWAHVKRTAQESFDPEAFVVRRSMPWADESGEGLMFVAFGKSFDAFEAQLRRMSGLEDGVTDGLFRFTRPISGSYFWCPPVSNGRLSLTALSKPTKGLRLPGPVPPGRR